MFCNPFQGSHKVQNCMKMLEMSAISVTNKNRHFTLLSRNSDGEGFLFCFLIVFPQKGQLNSKSKLSELMLFMTFSQSFLEKRIYFLK